jgi:hypothetical protein
MVLFVIIIHLLFRVLSLTTLFAAERLRKTAALLPALTPLLLAGIN